ncbi:Dyp-type peroxidase [Amycolatopsis acidicola]|uniref:Dyp-type peroxidase n=1 Tax=Amycolatopsis acidicola TaxID=2596893 RepID=A0A5N0VJ91_9PSEU|nr:Dyp-type peroxidase [Amycolatopsis acidicola]KAA9165718.1 Dyp-type peroxidase [Amycolatopsis acidicola]
MPVDLSTQLSWRTTTGDAADMLDELQPNILKAHVRDHLQVLLLEFRDGAEARAFLSSVARLMKSARAQLEEVAAFKATKTPGTPYIGLGLTAGGYATLGIATAPTDSAFLGGAKKAAPKLADPPVQDWDEPYRQAIDAILLIGDARPGPVWALRDRIDALRPESVRVLGEETGHGMTNENGDGIEHFGYVDGRSQPLFLTEDHECATGEWDPAAPLSQVLVSDTAAPDPGVHFGSYFVFRKLEQNVRLFKETEKRLDDSGQPGATLIGRFPDGTPLVSPDANDFTYDNDKLGRKCPFHAHIRKTNPRGSGGAEPPERERLHLMARRGQTYGRRLDDPGTDLPPILRPTSGVGLLFMAFNSNLGNQFEFTQRLWANDTGFPITPDGSRPGRDPLIGQCTAPEWGRNGVTAADPVSRMVTLKGGEYFFMPSLAFLRAL